MNILTKTLQQFGLSDNEITVYTEAIKHEEVSPYKLSTLTKIPRTTIYDVMTSLALKGLIELIQSQGLEKQQTKIKARNPSVLRQMIRKRKKDLTKLEVAIVGILPMLKVDYFKSESNADFKFYPGVNGAKYIMRLESEDTADLQTYVFDNLMPMDSFGKDWINTSVKRELKSRAKSRTRSKNIIALNDWTRHVLTYQYERDKDYIKYQEFRYIDNPILKIKQTISIKADRLRIVCADKDEIYGLQIISSSLVETFKSIFLVLWNISTPVTDEFVMSLGKNEFLGEEKRKGR